MGSGTPGVVRKTIGQDSFASTGDRPLYPRRRRRGRCLAEPRAPRIRDAATRPDTVATLLKRHDADDIEELQGASFVGYLPLRKSTTSDRLFLFVEDLK